MQRTSSRAENIAVALAAVLLIGVIPCLNIFLSPEHYFYVSDFTINLYGKCIGPTRNLAL